MIPFAFAKISGSSAFPNLSGNAIFYRNPKSPGVLVKVEVTGLPDTNSPIRSNFYGMHIHEFGDCTLPFDKTGNHYNPRRLNHPYHAGDMPPLLGNNGYAFSLFYTNRFSPRDILHKSLILHLKPDDFVTQPSGNSGDKIGCGVIEPLPPKKQAFR
ncbi:MAG: superoxide dismutase family protein [Lachnospiraceae bacterium]|nr:superoxide dismutase family protein [Lachnospiraceae bacterium]